MGINTKLLRLSLFQLGLGFSTVVFTGTLNRVLISEEGIPATAVAWLLSLSLFVAPLRVMFGAKSDVRLVRQGYRRLPYVWYGSTMIFGGLSAAPFCLMFLSKSSAIGPETVPFAFGMLLSTIIFLVYAIGVHIAQTGYLALATDLVPRRDRHSAVVVLWVAMIIGQIISSLVISWFLIDYTPGKLIQIMQSSSLIFMVLALIAIVKQDPFGKIEGAEEASLPRIRALLSDRRNQLFFGIVFLGTFAINGQDVLLEPYGGQVLGMTVHETTRLTALLGAGMLAAMALAAALYRRFASPLHMALLAIAVSLVGFGLVIGTGSLHSIAALGVGTVIIGVANGLFLISTLSIVFAMSSKDTAGLFVGVWGLVQTTAIGIGTLIGGLTRDTATRASQSVVSGYMTFYVIEFALCALTGLLLVLLIRALRGSQLLFPARQQSASVFAGLSEIPGG